MMNISLNSWYKAIFDRYSVVNFDSRPIEEKDMERLERICNIFKPYNEVRIIIINNTPESLYKNIMGPSKKIKGAPACIAFIGNKDNPHIYETVGYTGEGIILEATSMGLGTCWMGGIYDIDILKYNINLREEENIIAISPIGYPANKLTFDERLLSKFKTGRKTIDEITNFKVEDDWIKEAVDSARLAPSVLNRQPWRFIKEGNDILIKMDEPSIDKRLDCGIAMLHFQLGALSQDVEGEWIFLDSPNVGKFSITK